MGTWFCHLAMPAYIVAYVYTDLLDYAGPVQIWLRDYFGWQSPNDYWFFDIRSMGGAIAMLSLVLFPYVYLLARAGFAEQNAALTHASRTLGASPAPSHFLKFHCLWLATALLLVLLWL